MAFDQWVSNRLQLTSAPPCQSMERQVRPAWRGRAKLRTAAPRDSENQRRFARLIETIAGNAVASEGSGAGQGAAGPAGADGVGADRRQRARLGTKAAGFV